MLNSNFSHKLYFLLKISSVNTHVIKIITQNLADVWHIIFSLILLTFFIGYKNLSQMKVLSTVKYVFLLKTSLSE